MSEEQQKIPLFDFVKFYDPLSLLNILQRENPQTIAVVLSYMETAKAAIILQNLPSEVKADVLLRIAVMGLVDSEFLHILGAALEEKLSSVGGGIYSAGGIESAVEILNHVDVATEKQILQCLEDDDPELAEEIKKRSFVFEDIIMLDDRSIQKVLREIDTVELAKALRATKKEVQEKFFRNMSKRAACMLKEDMEYMGPIRKIDAEEAQQKMISIVRQLEDTGEIVVARASDQILVDNFIYDKDSSDDSTDEDDSSDDEIDFD